MALPTCNPGNPCPGAATIEDFQADPGYLPRDGQGCIDSAWIMDDICASVPGTPFDVTFDLGTGVVYGPFFAFDSTTFNSEVGSSPYDVWELDLPGPWTLTVTIDSPFGIDIRTIQVTENL